MREELWVNAITDDRRSIWRNGNKDEETWKEEDERLQYCAALRDNYYNNPQEMYIVDHNSKR